MVSSYCLVFSLYSCGPFSNKIELVNSCIMNGNKSRNGTNRLTCKCRYILIIVFILLVDIKAVSNGGYSYLIILSSAIDITSHYSCLISGQVIDMHTVNFIFESERKNNRRIHVSSYYQWSMCRQGEINKTNHAYFRWSPTLKVDNSLLICLLPLWIMKYDIHSLCATKKSLSRFLSS